MAISIASHHRTVRDTNELSLAAVASYSWPRRSANERGLPSLAQTVYRPLATPPPSLEHDRESCGLACLRGGSPDTKNPRRSGGLSIGG